MDDTTYVWDVAGKIQDYKKIWYISQGEIDFYIMDGGNDSRYQNG